MGKNIGVEAGKGCMGCGCLLMMLGLLLAIPAILLLFAAAL